MEKKLYHAELEPTLLPGHVTQVAGQAYKVKETRPAYPWTHKETNLTSDTSVNLKEEDLKGEKGQLLEMWLELQGTCQFTMRLEGEAGDVLGGWGGKERSATEDTPQNMAKAWIFGENYGWIQLTATPVITPAWFKVKASGYVYQVEKTTEEPVTIPAYIGR